MKKLTTLLFISILAVTLSCSSDSKKIVGKWKVVKYDIPQIPELVEKQVMMSPDSIREEYRQMLNKNVEQMKAEVMASTFEFTREGAFNIITTDYTQKGSWSLSKDSKMIFSRDSTASYTDTFYIINLSKKELEFKITNAEKVESIFGLEKIQ